MKITNGSVTYSHVVKVEDYGVNKKAEVSLSFIVDEDAGEDGATAAEVVAELAMARVKKMLTGKKAPVEQAVQTLNKAFEVANSVPPPATVIDASPPEAPAPVEVSAVPDREPDPISDKELHSAATRRNEAIKNPVAIRKLVAEYNPDPSKTFTMQQIPQGKRREFLDKLAALA
jgi:hypothetical protein